MHTVQVLHATQVMRSNSTDRPRITAQESAKVLPTNASSKYLTREPAAQEMVITTTNQSSRSQHKPTTVDIYFLGITIALGGQYFGWTGGLAAGVGSFLIAFIVVSLAYVTFCLCMAEISGALPFAGGSYGLARCTLGFYPAFLIGCFEALEYMIAVATIMNSLSDMLVEMFPSITGAEPFIWLFFYLLAVALQIRGERWFWSANLVLAVLSGGILLIYCVGGLSEANFRAQVLDTKTELFIGGMKGVIESLPFAAWFCIGIEALNLASSNVTRPTIQIPKAQVSCITTLVIMGLATLLVTVSLPMVGGIPLLARSLTPLNYGFMITFKTTTTVATLLSIPATCSAGFGFLWCSTKLVHAMAASRLLPWRLASVSRRYDTPYSAAITCAMISYGISALVDVFPVIKEHVFPLCLLFAFLSYTGQCIGYIALRRRYPPLRQSAFKNPLGISGAIYAMLVWLVGIISVVDYDKLAFAATLMTLLSVYYHVWAKRRQVISADENKILLKTHIWRNNGLRQQRNRRGSKNMLNKPGIASTLSQLFAVNKRTSSLSSSQQSSARARFSKAPSRMGSRTKDAMNRGIAT